MLKTKLSVLAVISAAFFATQTTLAEQKADQKFVDDSSYAVGVLMGKNIEQIVDSQKDIFAYNQEKLLAGVQDTLKKSGKLTDEDLQKQLKALDGYLLEQEAKISAQKAQEAKTAGEKFRAEFEKKAGVKKTESGLLYKIEQAGEGESPKVEDDVKVHYKGTLTDGTVFDSSYERGQPVAFPLSQLIPAWKEAIPMLKKGGKMQIVVPPELGYGEQATGKIPANSTLIFDIELIDFKSAEKKDKK